MMKRKPKLKKDEPAPFQAPYTYEAGIAQLRDKNYMMVADIRGWGHLTGTEGLNLEEHEAASLQNAFGKKLARLLNEDHKRKKSGKWTDCKTIEELRERSLEIARQPDRP